MKRLFALVVAAALAVPALALAHTTSYESEITIEYVTGPDMKGGEGPRFAGGFVDSERGACVSNRKVKLFALVFPATQKRGDEPLKVLVDTDRTSDNGAWSGVAEFPVGTGGLQAKLVKKDIGKRKHKHVCGAASDIIT